MCGPEKPHVIASGAVPSGLSAAGWVRLSLSFKGSKVTAALNGEQIATVSSTTFTAGMAAVGSGWHTAAFDDVSVTAI
jgi:hypothetical protein